MAVKTFTAGEVLTASDTNTYLANSGLVYVTSATVGSGVTSVTVSNCFSSTYSDYQINLNGIVSSTGTQLRLTLGSANTSYYSTQYYDLVGGGATGSAYVNNGAFWRFMEINVNVGENACSLIVNGPNTTNARKNFYGNYVGANFGGWAAGQLVSSTQFTSFTITPATGTITGGTLTIFGFRKA
jgi:hypothetical protein